TAFTLLRRLARVVAISSSPVYVAARMEILPDPRSRTIQHDPLERRVAGRKRSVAPRCRSTGGALPDALVPSLRLPAPPELWTSGRSTSHRRLLRTAVGEKPGRACGPTPWQVPLL